MFKNPGAWLRNVELKVLNEWATKVGIEPLELEDYLIDYDDKHITVFIYQSITEENEEELKQLLEKELYGEWKVKVTRLLGR